MTEDNKPDITNKESVETSTSSSQTSAQPSGAAPQTLRPPAPQRPPSQPPAKQPKRVEVLVDNLGPDLLKKGTVTSDESVVALLKTTRGRTLVREVK